MNRKYTWIAISCYLAIFLGVALFVDKPQKPSPKPNAITALSGEGHTGTSVTAIGTSATLLNGKISTSWLSTPEIHAPGIHFKTHVWKTTDSLDEPILDHSEIKPDTLYLENK